MTCFVERGVGAELSVLETLIRLPPRAQLVKEILLVNSRTILIDRSISEQESIVYSTRSRERNSTGELRSCQSICNDELVVDKVERKQENKTKDEK